MQFREQGKQVQCIRSTYSSEHKRSQQKVVAAFDRYATTLPTAEIAALTDQERSELTAWFEARDTEKRALRHASLARTAAGTLTPVADAISAVGKTMSAADAAATWAALDQVAQALRQTGHAKPKAKAKRARAKKAAK